MKKILILACLILLPILHPTPGGACFPEFPYPILNANPWVIKSYDAQFSLTFDERMNASTVNPSTFLVYSSLNPSSPIAGTVVYNEANTLRYTGGTQPSNYSYEPFYRAVLTPSPSVTIYPNTDYTAILKTGAKTLSGYSLAQNFSFKMNHSDLKSAKNVTVASYTTPARHYASVAMNAYGNSVVVWQRPTGVYGQKYSPNGTPSGSIFTVTTTNYYSIYYGANVAMDPQGNFMVVWKAKTGPIMAQKYWANGTLRGSVIQINSTGFYPQVATDGNGISAVAWHSIGRTNNNDWNTGFIYGRIVQADGSLGSSAQFGPPAWPIFDLKMNKQGDVAVIWMAWSNTFKYDLAQLEIFHVNGSPATYEFNAFYCDNPTAGSGAHRHWSPYVAISNNSYKKGGSCGWNSAYILVYKDTWYGNMPISFFPSWPYDGGQAPPTDQYGPSTAMFPDGGYITTWRSYGQDDGGDGVYFRRVRKDGSWDSISRVNSYNNLLVSAEEVYYGDAGFTIFQERSPVAVSDNGDFVIVWNSHDYYDKGTYSTGEGYGVYAKFYDVQ